MILREQSSVSQDSSRIQKKFYFHMCCQCSWRQWCMELGTGCAQWLIPCFDILKHSSLPEHSMFNPQLLYRRQYIAGASLSRQFATWRQIKFSSSLLKNFLLGLAFPFLRARDAFVLRVRGLSLPHQGGVVVSDAPIPSAPAVSGCG